METEKPKNQPYELTPGGERALLALRKVFRFSKSHLNLLGQIDRTSHEASILFLATLIGTRANEQTTLLKILRILESIFINSEPEHFELEGTIFQLRVHHKSSESNKYRTSLEVNIVKEDKLGEEITPQISIGISLPEIRVSINNLLSPPKTNSTAKGAQYNSRGGLSDSYER